MAMRDIGSPAPHLKAMGRLKALGSRRSGRAGEPAVGDSMGASESLDDVPQDPRLPSYPPVGPTHRLRDLYGSLSALLGIKESMGRYVGVHLIAFGVADAPAEAERLGAAGFRLQATVNLRRTIEAADGSEVQVAFTVVRARFGSIPE